MSEKIQDLTLLTKYRAVIGLALVLFILLLFYMPTLQTIINGSSHLMMIDVGETQIVLNEWGTLHSTGYPHYVITGNILVAMMRLVGVEAVTAPALVSLLWGMLALGLLFLLVLRLSNNALLAFLLVLVFGLTRFVWVHNVVAEIYSFSLFLQVLLLVIAFWGQPLSYHISLLAFLGGLGAAHHRGIGLMAPALIVAVWPQLWPEIRRRPAKIALWLGLGLLGFLPYLYLPLRAEAGATWVYGNPSDWEGFWEQFNGAEADYLFGWPNTYEQFQQNFERVNELLVDELSIAGVGLGILGLAIGLTRAKYRRYSLALILSALVAYSFSTVLYYDILATLILSITLSLALGWVLLADSLLQRPQVRRNPAALVGAHVMVAGLALAGSVWLNEQNAVWIYNLTHDETGIETIELAQHTPPEATLMMDWGPRYFAVGFAQDVEGQLQHFDRVDHKGNFKRIVANGILVTPEYTLYRKPVLWWERRLNSPVYLTAAGPELVQIDTVPQLLPVTDWPEVELADNAPPVAVLDYGVSCSEDRAVLQVDWLALNTPDRDMSVMVHLVEAKGSPQLLEADQLHPVYGWRPLTTWQTGEIVRDFYPVKRLPGGNVIRFGLYEVLPQPPYFVNYLVHTASINCD